MEFPVWVVLTHFLNLLFLTLLARSGIEILSALPKLYVNDHCPPGREFLRFSKKVFSADSRKPWSSLDEEESWSPVVALPGRKNLGIGRHWHFMTMQFWILTGLVYIALLFVSGEWRRLVPTEWSIVPDAFHAAATYLDGHLAEAPPGRAYNALQQLAYFSVVFLLAPLQIATGAAMSPAIAARFPRYPRLFGGKQVARTLHFLGLCALASFVVGHTVMVLLHGVGDEFTRIVLASDPAHANETAALVVGVAGLLLVLAINVLATIVSLRRRRAVQRVTGKFVNPLQHALSSALGSRQRYSRADISPFHRVNGYPPPDPGYKRMAKQHFDDYRLGVGGLVERPASLSLAELRALGQTSNVTMHNCIQGWTRLRRVGRRPVAGAARARPPALERPLRRVLRVRRQDDHGRRGPLRSLLRQPPDRARPDPHTILALDMNGEPLPIEHGAPVRLRAETQLGFKMVKWIRAIEVVERYEAIGLGQGGWREDQQFYANEAGI